MKSLEYYISILSKSLPNWTANDFIDIVTLFNPEQEESFALAQELNLSFKEHSNGFLLSASHLIATENYSKAVSELTPLIQNQPTDWRVLLLLVQALYQIRTSESLFNAEKILIQLFSHPVAGQLAKQLFDLKTETECFHGDPNYKKVFQQLIKTLRPTHFIEMGTFLGRSSGFIAKTYPKINVVTAEVNPNFAAIAKHRLSGSNVQVVVSDSVQFLRDFLPSLPHTARLLVYLDSHWYDSWPLIEEIQILEAWCNNFVLVIDDFQVPGQPQFVYDNYGGEKVCNWEKTHQAMNERYTGALFPKYQKSAIPKGVSLAGYGIFFWDSQQNFEACSNLESLSETHFSMTATELNALIESESPPQVLSKVQVELDHPQSQPLADPKVAPYSDVIDYMADKSLPYMVSFPRTGSHWLRMVLEKYIEKPFLVRSFFHDAKPPYALFHTHDMDLGLFRDHIIYLHRDPVDTIYSQMKFHNEPLDNEERIIYWSKLYGQHAEKWLIHQNQFIKSKCIIHYDELTDSSRNGFKKAIEFLGSSFDKDRLEAIVSELSKEKIKEKTAHDPRVTQIGSAYEHSREDFKTQFSTLVWEHFLDGKPELAELLNRSYPEKSESIRVSHPQQAWEYKKIIALIPMKNEERFIETTLRAIAPIADSIIVFDDQSTDDSISIVKQLQHQLPIEHIIERNEWNYNETVYRQELLNEGRKRGGTHFICIDSDELFTSNFIDNHLLRKQIFSLAPGDKLNMAWIQLWRSLEQYRYDKSVWTNNYKVFAFADDGVSNYDEQKLHLLRHPLSLKGKTYSIPGYTYGLMHLQFVHWENLLLKQAWYRILEKVMNPQVNEQQVNAKYAPSKDEKDLQMMLSPFSWFKNYPFIHHSRIHEEDNWRKQQVLGWFNEYGTDYFKNLDIWDVDWGVSIPENAYLP